MSLAGVLVDRGRVVTYTGKMTVASPGHPSVPVRVEGATQMEWITGPWFDCRVDAPGGAESNDAADGRVRTDVSLTFIYSLEDDTGAVVRLTADSRVEVDSEELGLAMFEVTGEPQLYRKRRDLVAGQATIKRVLDYPVAGLPVEGRTGVGLLPSGAGTVV